MAKKSLSVIIPCYNEENNLRRGVLDQVYGYLQKQGYPFEMIICNDGSTDLSLKLVKAFAKGKSAVIALDLPHGGKPSALFGGIQQASLDYCLFSDMDQSTPIDQMAKLWPFFPDYDLVIGSRGFNRNNASLVRKLMSRAFTFLRRLLLLPSIVDTQCGFKAFKTSAIKDIFPKLDAVRPVSGSTGWRVSAYDVELLFLAQLKKYKIKEVDVKWQNEDTSTSKGDNATRFKKESISMAKEIWRLKVKELKGFHV